MRQRIQIPSPSAASIAIELVDAPRHVWNALKTVHCGVALRPFPNDR